MNPISARIRNVITTGWSDVSILFLEDTGTDSKQGGLTHQGLEISNSIKPVSNQIFSSGFSRSTVTGRANLVPKARRAGCRHATVCGVDDLMIAAGAPDALG